MPHKVTAGCTSCGFGSTRAEFVKPLKEKQKVKCPCCKKALVLEPIGKRNGVPTTARDVVQMKITREGVVNQRADDALAGVESHYMSNGFGGDEEKSHLFEEMLTDLMCLMQVAGVNVSKVVEEAKNQFAHAKGLDAAMKRDPKMRQE